MHRSAFECLYGLISGIVLSITVGDALLIPTEVSHEAWKSL